MSRQTCRVRSADGPMRNTTLRSGGVQVGVSCSAPTAVSKDNASYTDWARSLLLRAKKAFRWRASASTASAVSRAQSMC
eukprot:980463-Pleurochrysis_carterae.AAC.1